mgnify:CR=1 FL=1
MKEFEVRAELTVQSNPSTLEGKGNIFMPDAGQPEIPAQKGDQKEVPAKSTEKAINSFLKQKIPEKYEIIVADPFKEVHQYLKKKFISKHIKNYLTEEDLTGELLKVYQELIKKRKEQKSHY